MDYIPILHAASLQDKLERKQICGANDINVIRGLLNPPDDGTRFQTPTNRLNQSRRIFVVQTLEPQLHAPNVQFDDIYNIRQRGRQPPVNDSQWAAVILGFVIVMPDTQPDTALVGMICSVEVENLVITRALLAKALLFLGSVRLPTGYVRTVRITPTDLLQPLLQQIGFLPSNDGTFMKQREHEVPKLLLNDFQWDRLFNINFAVGIYCGPSQRLNQFGQQWIANPKKRKLFCNKYKLGTDYRKGNKSIRY
jgi:hypothetical protein